jgi:hypothetical protein
MLETTQKPARLTSAEVTSLCDAADSAWLHSPKEREVYFFWRHRLYKSRRGSCRLLVETMDDEPIACRYE